MEHLKSYYTIEKHLEETSRANESFEILDAIWKLNKRNLSSALSNISQFFPHYSLHDRSHSNTIINNIESFLGEERIKRLSPTNAWLILMSSFTHDLGMIVFQDLIEREWLSEDFQFYLKETSKISDDIDLQKSAKLLLLLQKISDQEEYKEKKLLTDLQPLSIRNAVTLVVAEYIRRIHHKRSSEIIDGTDKAFFDISNSFYADQIPQRLLNILAEVAYLHGVEFYEIFNRLDYESNGISSDKVNPRFISCLLRLGDLLDVDDNRFNIFTEKVFKFPTSSIRHKKKHSSIRHLLITPESIEITADCPDEDTFRLARGWFDWLEEEVLNQSKEWSNIAPPDLGGSSPTIPKGKIKVFFNEKITDEKLLNLRFQISNKKIFEIIEGSSLYENAEFTFLRELVQNALDASKIQLWKEIDRGTFDFVFKRHFEDSNLTHADIIRKIKFPEDIPSMLYEGFEVDLRIDWNDKSKDELVITVQDFGTGISNNDLIRMTNSVGESRKKDQAYLNLIKSMPFWLKPTGAFGIGLQSLFLVAESFIVQTKAEGEDSKEIIFRSAKNDKYSSISKKQPTIIRGTKVLVNVPAGKFSEVFGSSFSSEVLWGYDYFTDEHKNVFIPKIKNHIATTFSKIDSLIVRYFDSDVKKVANDSYASDSKVTLSQRRSKNISSKFYLDNKNLVFHFFENIIGSELQLTFTTPRKLDYENERLDLRPKYYVRDIPIDNQSSYFFEFSHMNFQWNLMSPESDKILNISREKIIYKNFRPLINELFDKILPLSFEDIQHFIKENKNKLIEEFENEKERLSYAYFKILLSMSSYFKIENRRIQELLGEDSLRNDLASFEENRQIDYHSFFEIQKFLLPSIRRIGTHKDQLENKKRLVNKKKGEIEGDRLIIWDGEFFNSYIWKEYSVKRIFFSDLGELFFLEKNKEDTSIHIDEEGFDLYLKTFVTKFRMKDRPWCYSCSKYGEKLSVIGKSPTGFEHLAPYSKEFIISPFRSHNEFLEFKKSVSNFSDKTELEKLISLEKVQRIIPETLINWVLENAPKRYSSRSTEDVVHGYKVLITDIIYST